MLYFLGNCQADFVSRVMATRGYPCTYRVLASPLTYPSHPGAIPDSLSSLNAAMQLDDYFHGRELGHQFLPIAPGEPAPDAIILSLFHENVPLFVHNEEGYVFFMDPRAFADKPDVMQWAQDNCRMFKPNPATYLDRYGKMLAQLRRYHPSIPIVILQRLSHFPAFGPDPFSYLDGWETLWPKAEATLSGWTSTLDNVHILDMNRVFGGVWQRAAKRIENHCPFLKIKLEEKDGQVVGLHAQRDIEHIGPMPDALADKLAGFLDSGEIAYAEEETSPHEWRRQWRPARPDEGDMLRQLSSGANYQGAEAVAGFFMNLGKDYTPLLVEAKERMAVCHMTLHMIKAYGRIHCNPELAVWCDAHMEAARRFTANGPIYQDAYIARVQEMKQHALSG